MYQTIYRCPFGAGGKRRLSALECAKHFAAQHHPPLQIHDTDDTGNCFFDSLSQFGAATQYPPLAKSHSRLREELVSYAIQHLDEILPHMELHNTEDPLNTVLALGENGAWCTSMGDIAPQIAPHAFHVNLILFNVHRTVKKKASDPLVPDEIQRAELWVDPAAPTMMLLRINDGHYQWFSEKEHGMSRPASLSRSKVHPVSPAHVQHENEKWNVQDELNRLHENMAGLQLESLLASQPSASVAASASSSTSPRRTITRRKKKNNQTVRNVSPSKQQYNQFRYLIQQIKKMKKQSVNKQNAIISLTKNIVGNNVLSMNQRGALLNDMNRL